MQGCTSLHNTINPRRYAGFFDHSFEYKGHRSSSQQEQPSTLFMCPNSGELLAWTCNGPCQGTPDGTKCDNHRVNWPIFELD